MSLLSINFSVSFSQAVFGGFSMHCILLLSFIALRIFFYIERLRVVLKLFAEQPVLVTKKANKRRKM